MDHQEFSYMNSQFIFYCDAAEQQHKSRTISQLTNRTSINKAYSRYNKFRRDKQNKRNIATCTSKHRVKLNNKQQINNVKFKVLDGDNHANSKTCETQVRDYKKIQCASDFHQQTVRTIEHQSKSIDAKESKTEKKIKKQKDGSQKLSHCQIKQLFGEYHCFYKLETDYLQKQLYSEDDNKKEQLPQNMEQKAQQQDILQNYSYLKSSKAVPQTPLKQTNSYIFQNDRAPIVQFIHEHPSKYIYERLISINLKKQVYIDEQFNHYKIKQIGESSNIEWFYISPQPALPIFPSAQIQISYQPLNSQLEWIKFMQVLYRIEPAAFWRLFEPPINNVFSVWLYFDGIYQPVTIDGYFPFDQRIFGSSPINHWWLPIFVKCICKIVGTFDINKLKSISDAQLYNLIYGQKLQSILSNQLIVRQNTLNEFYNKKIKKSKAIILKKDNEFKVLQYDEKTKTIQFRLKKRELTLNDIKDGLIYEIKQLKNGYIRALKTMRNQTTIYDLNIEKNCRINLSQYCHRKSCKSTLLIYKCQIQQKTNIMRLKLKYELNMKKSSEINLDRGQYKLFIDTNSKSLHNYNKSSDLDCIEESKTNEQQQVKIITMVSSIKVTVSEGTQLISNQGQLEDISNIYLV